MMEFKCSCERGVHRAPLVNYIIESGVLNKLPELLKDYSRIYVVADSNTYKAAGKRVEEILKQSGQLHAIHVLEQTEVLPNAQTLGEIVLFANDPAAKSNLFAYATMPDLILGVGSGTINDSCKLAGYRLGIPCGIVATAPSMDGYASAGCPFLYSGSKATVQATTVKYIIADLDVLAEAPYDMMLAGIGDMFGKYTGMLDWELARDYTGEYFCDNIGRDVIAAADKCLVNGYKLAGRGKDSIKAIMEGFLVTGLGMAYVGNSRPASGSEHIVAHAWELYDVEHGHAPNLHGLEVCEGTRLIAIMYKMLYEETDDRSLKALIEKYLPYFDAVEEFCVKMQVPPTVTDRQIILDSIDRALIMRDRYTLLFYLRDRGMLKDYAQRATDKLLEILNK